MAVMGNRGYQKMRNSAGLDPTAWSAFTAAGGPRDHVGKFP